MRHEIYNVHQGVPSGYATYSVLLIPDESWFSAVGMDDAFRLFSQFKRFGEMIGPDHLACWFYHYFGNYQTSVKLDLVGALPVEVYGDEAVAEYLRNKIDVGREKKEMRVAYDFPRARLICTSFGLTYDRGPYVFFFTEPPQLPYYEQYNGGGYGQPVTRIRKDDKLTSPACVLTFGGLRFDRALSLLDRLEQQLIRSDVSVTKLKWEQFLVRLREWFHKHGETVVDILKGVLGRRLNAKGEATSD